MNDPWRSFISQPWLALGKVAAVTTLIVLLGDMVLVVGLRYSVVFRRLLMPLLTFPLGTIVGFAAAIGTGALGVVFCELWQIGLNTARIWALVLCLIVGIALKSMIFADGLIYLSRSGCLLGLMIGVFWKGYRYWRVQGRW